MEVWYDVIAIRYNIIMWLSAAILNAEVQYHSFEVQYYRCGVQCYGCYMSQYIWMRSRTMLWLFRGIL